MSIDTTITTAIDTINTLNNTQENSTMNESTTAIVPTTFNSIINNKENNTMENTAIVTTATPIVYATKAPTTEPIRDKQAFVRIPGWREMGKTVDHEPTTEEMYKLAGLDWTVSKKKVGFFDDNGFFHDTENFGLVRNEDNTFYGFCKNKYNIFQNAEAFGWCEPLVDSGLFKWETAGSFRKGQTCWCLLNSGEYNVATNDSIRNYLLVAWSHDGKRGIVIQPTSIRVICENTLNAALTNKEERDNRIHIPHFVTMRPKLEEVRAMYEGAVACFEIQKAKYEKMINTVLSESQKISFIDSVCNIVYEDTSLINGMKMLSAKAKKHVESVREGFKTNLREMMDYRASGQTQLGIQNTLYGAFNAASEMIEHHMTQRGTKDGYSVLFGDRGKQIRMVEELANNYATGIDKFVPVSAIA